MPVIRARVTLGGMEHLRCSGRGKSGHPSLRTAVAVGGFVLVIVGLLGAGCGDSDSAPTVQVGQLPAGGAIVYSIHSDGALGLGAYEEGRLRSGPPGSDTGLTETDHRAVLATSSDGRLVLVDDFHADGGVFARWRGANGAVRTRRLRVGIAGSIALCGSRSVAYADDDHLMLWGVGSAAARTVAAPMEPRRVACSGDADIAALAADGTLMLGTAREGLRALGGGSRFSSVEWSPDARSLAACTLPAADTAALVLLARNGSLQRRLADAGDRCEIAWSPDRSRIAITDARGYLRVACVCDQVAVTVASSAWDPVWSPDGSAIAYSGLVGLHAMHYPSGRPVLIVDEMFPATIAWIDGMAARRVRNLADRYPCC